MNFFNTSKFQILRACGLAGFAAFALSACGGGGGGGGGSPAPIENVIFPSAQPGDPVFSSDCDRVPSRLAVGPFTFLNGDCVATYVVTTQELNDSSLLIPKLKNDLQSSFKEGFDLAIVLMDVTDQERSAFNYVGFNSSQQPCIFHNQQCPRTAKLGLIGLANLTYIKTGPMLHEIAHGFMHQVSANSLDGFVVPTTVSAHWGFSSAEGQLGGFKKSSLQQIGTNTYTASGPDRFISKIPYSNGFGTFANGGNSVPYSNIELWSMGLIPDSSLESISYAINPQLVSGSVFKADSFVTISATDITARIRQENRPKTTSPRALRGIVVLATRNPTQAASYAQAINSDISQFTQRREPENWGGIHNYWTATGGSGSLHLATLSQLAR